MDWIGDAYTVVGWDLFCGIVYRLVDDDEIYHIVPCVEYMELEY